MNLDIDLILQELAITILKWPVWILMKIRKYLATGLSTTL
jgi:hypothetical protein